MPDAGWYPDPQDPNLFQWWDGQRWTGERQPATALSTPPPAPIQPLPAAVRSNPGQSTQSPLSAKGFFSSLFDFSFSSFITTKVIKLLYVVITIVTSLGALGFFIGAVTRGGAATIVAVIFVPIFWLLYIVLARISLEFIMIVFRMGDDVRAIAGRDEAARGTPNPYT